MGGGDARARAATALEGQTDIAKKQQANADQLMAESSPWRKAAGNYYSDILSGGQALNRAVAPKINSATNQFSLARRSIEDMAPGGMRDIALRNLNMEEAKSKTGIRSGGLDDALSKLGTLSMAEMNAAMGGYGSAAGTLSSVAGANTQIAGDKGNTTAGLGAAGGTVGAATITAISA